MKADAIHLHLRDTRPGEVLPNMFSGQEPALRHLFAMVIHMAECSNQLREVRLELGKRSG